MLANTHRRHLVSNRLALATGLILLLAQTGQLTPDSAQDGAQAIADNQQTVVVNEADTEKKHSANVLLNLGLLLIGH